MESSMRSAFKNSKTLHDMPFRNLTTNDLQKVIDECPLKHSSVELIVTLFHQMYSYAGANDLVDKDYSKFVKINIEDDDEKGVPFSDEELETLWKHKDNPVIEFILIMCYSGYRITAYKSIEVNLEEKYFLGGIKTKSSKKRIVPIHSGIYELVEKRLKRDGILLDSTNSFRNDMYDTLQKINIQKHTPHDCRHTFSKLCDKYEVRENDKKRMLGHTFSDITNKTYGHRDLEDLRKEIEKIICH
jgi:integrase